MASALASKACSMRVMVLLLSNILYHLGGAQARDFGIALAEQPAQDFFGVLAQERRCQPVFERRFGKTHRARHERQQRARAVLEFDAHAAHLDLRLFENLRHVVDRAVRHASRLQQLEPFTLRALAKDGGEEPRELRAVLDALAVGREARIAGELRATGGGAPPGASSGSPVTLIIPPMPWIMKS